MTAIQTVNIEQHALAPLHHILSFEPLHDERVTNALTALGVSSVSNVMKWEEIDNNIIDKIASLFSATLTPLQLPVQALFPIDFAQHLTLSTRLLLNLASAMDNLNKVWRTLAGRDVSFAKPYTMWRYAILYFTLQSHCI